MTGPAPARLRDCTDLGVPLDFAAHVTPQGLVANLLGSYVSPPERPFKAVIACELRRGNLLCPSEPKAEKEGVDVFKAGHVAVLLGQLRMDDPSQRRPLIAYTGALIRITEEKRSTLFVKHIQTASVIVKGYHYDEHPNPP